MPNLLADEERRAYQRERSQRRRDWMKQHEPKKYARWLAYMRRWRRKHPEKVAYYRTEWVRLNPERAATLNKRQKRKIARRLTDTYVKTILYNRMKRQGRPPSFSDYTPRLVAAERNRLRIIRKLRRIKRTKQEQKGLR